MLPLLPLIGFEIARSTTTHESTGTLIDDHTIPTDVGEILTVLTGGAVIESKILHSIY